MTNAKPADSDERGDIIAKPKRGKGPEQMAALLSDKLLQVIEAAEQSDAKTLRDCVAVLKELTALSKELTPHEDAGTGVILLPEVKKAE